jgi:hypothetical protein
LLWAREKAQESQALLVAKSSLQWKDVKRQYRVLGILIDLFDALVERQVCKNNAIADELLQNNESDPNLHKYQLELDTSSRYAPVLLAG